MNYKEHIMLGLAINIPFVIVLLYFSNLKFEYNFINIISLLILMGLGPLVMDLDHQHSKLRQVFTFFGLILGLFGVAGYYFNLGLDKLMVVGIIVASIGYMLCYITKHRDKTHSLLFTTIFTCIVYILTLNIFLCVIAFISCYSHLLGDKLYFKLI